MKAFKHIVAAVAALSLFTSCGILGGSGLSTGTTAITALLADAVSIPVLAAGGIVNEKLAKASQIVGAEGVFVGSGIFKSGNPEKRAQAIVKAVTNFRDAKLIAELSEDLGEAMVGINESEIKLIMEARGQ